MLKDILTTNYNEVLIVTIRALFSLITLFFITKLIGRKQVSELNLFDYVISISIGNFAAEMTINLEYQVLNGFISIIVFGIVSAFVSFLAMKSIFFRRIVMGTPIIIIDNGKFLYKNIKKLKLDINDILEIARSSGYFDISNIKYAIMEVSGRVSFLPFEKYLPVNNKDMNIKLKKRGLCANVIIDGNIMDNNLKMINKDKKWLKKNLKISGYHSTSDILLATIDENDKLSIFKKTLNDEKNVLE